MSTTIVITPNLINRIKSLPKEEKKAIFNAFACDEIFKIEREVKLTPYQELIYAIVKDYIMRDSKRYAATNNL